MKVTLKAVNAALPRTTYFNAFRRTQDAGVFPHNIRTIEKSIARLCDDGTVEINTYAYGDGKAPDDYYMHGICTDVTDVINEWHWKQSISRKDAVWLIRERLQAAESDY